MNDMKILIENYINESIGFYFNQLTCSLDDIIFTELVSTINPYTFSISINGSKIVGTIITEFLARLLSV
jgi:hypothetical protein